MTDGLKLIASRARLMQALPKNGGMLAVQCDEKEIDKYLADYSDLTIAAYNGPQNLLVSGVLTKLNTLTQQLKQNNIKATPLTVSHAFHSTLMEPIVKSFAKVAQSITYHVPQLILISNVTGQIITDDIATPNYWVKHIRQPVQFARGMEALSKNGYSLFIELGPQPVLLGMGQQCLENNETKESIWLPSLRHNHNDWDQLLDSLGYLYTSNYPIDWQTFHQPYAPSKTLLPTYPFQRKRYWVDAQTNTNTNLSQLPGTIGHPLLGRRVHSPTLKETILFESILSPYTPSFLNDHKVSGNVIFPSTGYIEMALAAGTEIFNIDKLTLEEVSIEQPLLLISDVPRVVQLVLTPSKDTKNIKYTFEIYSLTEQKSTTSKQWILHATGGLVSAHTATPFSIDLDVFKTRDRNEVDITELYERYATTGFNYGPSFQGLKTLVYKDNEVFAHIVLFEPATDHHTQYIIHPGLLDSCLQAASVAFPSTISSTYLPIKIKKLTVLRHSCTQVWVHVVVYTDQATAESKNITSDLNLYDESGQCVVQMEGVIFSQAASDMLEHMVQLKSNEHITQDSKLIKQLQAMPVVQRMHTLTLYLQHTVAQILGFSSHEEALIDQDLFRLGMDSLIAIELRNRLQTDLQCTLGTTLLFDNPNIEVLTKYLLKEPLAELTAIAHKISAATHLPITTISRTEKLPLSFSQQRLWFLDQLEPNSASYNIPLAMRLQGPLHHAALEQSINHIIARHESLRTLFVSKEGQAQQLILDEVQLTLTVEDLSSLSEQERDDTALQRCTNEATTAFELSTGPLLRAQLIKLADQNHLLLITFHHIISDGWSINVFMHELAETYYAFSQDNAPTLTPLPIQYVDFAHWQHQWFASGVLEEQLAYWKQQLHAAPALLEMPTDHPRPVIESHRGALHHFSFSKELTTKLNTLCEQENATLFMTLLATFNILLSKYSGQTDICVGSPIAGRTRAETENLIGLFLNTLVLRTRLDKQESFTQLLARVRNTALEAYAHQDLPFEQLVEAINPTRALNHSPLFQVMLVLQNMPQRETQASDLTFSTLSLDSHTAKHDFVIYVIEHAEQLYGSVEYNTDLFDESTIARLINHFEHLLESVTADPHQPIHALSLLQAQDTQQLLVEWNDTHADYPLDHSIADLFEQQVEHTPDAVALRFDEQSLSYTELNQKANQLAHYLITQGTAAETLVGICLPRSIDLAITLLATIKTGAAFLPLDANYPAERLQQMIEDAKPTLILTQSSLTNLFTSSHLKMICLNELQTDIATHAVTDLNITTTPDQLAYVLYTSGSTGIPKGIAVTHHQILNRLYWMWQTYPYATDEVGCQKTAFNFVDFLWEFFGPLLQGVPNIIIPDNTVKDPQQLVQILAQHRVTRLWLVPSLLRMLLESEIDLTTTLPHLTFWVTSGEALPTELYRRFQASHPHATLYNLYGTSEVWDATWWDPQQENNDISGSSIPIGRPIANTQIYILDAQCQPVPIGVSGELHISGVGLARGYLHRPELTKEKFIANPFGESRLYKTGDRARYLADGNIEYLGRLDHQIKLRGFRIEPGEIETILMSLPTVNEAVVLLHENLPGDPRLIAYVVTKEQQELNTDVLRADLTEHLSDYMLPSLFVCLDKLPLTPNGKVDRKTLATQSLEGLQQNIEEVLPQNETEQKLVEIIEDLLNITVKSIHQNYFELGLSSLNITNYCNQINNFFNTRLQLLDIFKFPTIFRLAEYITSNNRLNLATDLIQQRAIKQRNSRQQRMKLKTNK